MIRTPKLLFIESRASTPLLVSTIAIMAVGIFLPMGPLADYFKLQLCRAPTSRGWPGSSSPIASPPR